MLCFPRASSARATWPQRTLAALVLGLSGCAALVYSPPLPPTHHPAASSPGETHILQAAAAPPDQPIEGPLNYEELPPPRPIGPAALTLDQAINLCLLSDPKIRAGLERINQAHGDALTASLKPNPELATDIQLLPLGRPFTVTKQGGPPQFDFQIAYPIDWFLFGKRAAAMASAGLGVRASEAEYADLVRRRVTEVALAYFGVQEVEALRELARQDLDTLRNLKAIGDKGVKAGFRTQVEVNRVHIDVLSRQRDLRDVEAALVTAKAKLRTLLGRYYHPLDVAGTLEEPQHAELPPVEEAYALAVQHRPDLVALRWRVSQADADIEVENRKARPEVKPFLGYTRQFQKKAIGFPDADSWSAWLEMGLPLFNLNQGNRAKAVSRAVQGQWDLESGLMELRAEIETASEELAAARANADPVTQEQRQLAEQVRDAIDKAVRNKDKTLLDLVDAHRTYYEAQRAHIVGRANYWRALYKFNAAIGKQVAR